jgi:hypothetical protein
MSGIDELPPLPEAGRLLVETAAGYGHAVRLMGGVAIWLRATDEARRALGRDYPDLDLVAHKAQSRQLRALLEELGYVPDRLFNAMHGESRLLFHHGEQGYQVDVFLDEFKMSHVLDLGARLEVEEVTIPAAELLLTKLQIAEVNAKDIGDVAMLLWSHETADDDGPGRLNAAQVARICGRNWGLFTTVTDNLERTVEMLPEILTAAGPPTRDDGQSPAARISDRIAVIRERMTAQPKSLSWRTRARVGRRVRWYEVPEEVTR